MKIFWPSEVIANSFKPKSIPTEQPVLIKGCSSSFSTRTDMKYLPEEVWDIVADFIPCKYGNTPGVYDIVNGVFYQNSGSGGFTTGEIIQ